MPDIEDEIESENDAADSRPGQSGPASGAAAGPVPDHVKAQYPDRDFFEYREIFLGHLMRDLSERVPRHANDVRTGVDIGCNAGRYTSMLAQHGFAASGVDYDPALVAEAARAHPERSFSQGDAQALPFADNTFDCAVSLGIIQCLPNWRQAVSEGVRVVQPGGVVLIETNRAYPLAENLLRTVMYIGRRTMPFRQALDVFRAHRRAAGDSGESIRLRKFGYGDLVAHLAHLDVERVVVHDPRKRFGFHDFIWAIAAVKNSPGAAMDASVKAPGVTRCRHCRRHGVVRA